MCSALCAAVTVTRSRALPLGTVGKRIADTKMARSKSSSEISTALLSSPTRIGMMALRDSFAMPSAGRPFFNSLTLRQSVILENGFWAREERDELRLGARTLGVAVELHYLEAPVQELWRRLELRNEEASPGAAPIKREDLQKWALQFEAPDAAELALFDEAGFSAPC